MRPSWAIVGRCGKTYRHKQLAFFACEGLIALHDERPNCKEDQRFSVILPDDFDERARAMSRMAEPWKSGTPWQREEYRILKANADAVLEAVKEAKYMGDPGDPAVRAFWARHRPGHKSRVSLSAGANPEGYPQLPEVPLGRDTGRRTDAGAALSGVTGVPTIHVPAARRKKQSGILLDL